jgi:hypothetical protein
MDPLSAAGMDMAASASSLSYQVNLSMMKKSMDDSEQLALNELRSMLPQKGQFLDVYA